MTLKLLETIHDRAWGQSWPTITCTIHRRDIFPDETDNNSDDEDDTNNTADDDDNFDHIPAEVTFTGLLDVELLQDAFGISGSKLSVIVIRKEYEFLRDLLQKKDRPFIVTGQPGTGKTMFLLYLLIYRLQLALPTAVQFSPDEYIVFSAGGVSVCPTGSPIDHRSMLPPECWCLSDGNEDVMHPCQPFRRRGLRTFLITSSRPKEYKKWRTQAIAHTVITALPRAVEVAAIAKMNGLKPCDAVSVMRKWGPCTRTVIAVLGDPDQENDLRRYAVSAAIDICNDPSKVSLHDIGQLPSGHSSSLLFIRPIRCKNNPDYGDSRLIIPTMHLSEIFDIHCQNLSAQSRMRLQEIFHMKTTTRDPADWLHRKQMHRVMMGNSRCEIFNGNVRSHMSAETPAGAIRIPATPVPGGTASALRAAAHNRESSSFYWLPSLVNFPGIDGVLIDFNDIYVLQATITDTYDVPREGLKKVWQTIGADVARRLTWHFVLITDNKPLADKYATDLGTQLHDVALGRRPHVRVSAWVGVLKSDLWPWRTGDDESDDEMS